MADACANLDLFAWAATANPEQPIYEPSARAMQNPRNAPEEFLALASILEHHRGADSAITAPALAAAAGIWPEMTAANRGTKVRKILELSQDVWPWPLCSGPTGYFIPESPDELTHYCASLRSRAICDLRRFASVRRHAKLAGFRYLGHGRWA